MLCLDIGRVPGEFGHLPEYRGVTGTPRGVIGPTWALREKREGGRRWPRTPPFPSPNRTREGGRPLPSFSFSLPFSYSNKERRSPTPGGSRTPPLARLLRPAASSPPGSFIYGGRGHPIDTQVDLLAVCGAPLHSYTPRSYRSGA